VLIAFAGLLATGERPLASLEDGVRAVQIADACLRSAAEDGRPVELAPR
jgi:hypothetical protein